MKPKTEEEFWRYVNEVTYEYFLKLTSFHKFYKEACDQFRDKEASE